MLPPSHHLGEDLCEDLEWARIEWTWSEWLEHKYAHVSTSHALALVRPVRPPRAAEAVHLFVILLIITLLQI